VALITGKETDWNIEDETKCTLLAVGIEFNKNAAIEFLWKKTEVNKSHKSVIEALQKNECQCLALVRLLNEIKPIDEVSKILAERKKEILYSAIKEKNFESFKKFTEESDFDITMKDVSFSIHFRSLMFAMRL